MDEKKAPDLKALITCDGVGKEAKTLILRQLIEAEVEPIRRELLELKIKCGLCICPPEGTDEACPVCIPFESGPNIFDEYEELMKDSAGLSRIAAEVLGKRLIASTRESGPDQILEVVRDLEKKLESTTEFTFKVLQKLNAALGLNDTEIQWIKDNGGEIGALMPFAVETTVASQRRNYGLTFNESSTEGTTDDPLSNSIRPHQPRQPGAPEGSHNRDSR